MESIHAIKGTIDTLPGEIERWHAIEMTVRKWTGLFGYSEIRTPVFEDTRLFERSIGEDSDIVGKEMYTFTDMGGRRITLRPEGTASVVRAFIEHSLDQRGLPQSLWYMGPMFRQERPQKGRQRQFHQFGVEVIGGKSELLDVEVMELFDRIACDLGITGREYAVNYLGGAESRERYRTILVEFLDAIESALCPDCQRRRRTNPLRVLDCKVPGCREAVHGSGNLPKIVEYLSRDDLASYGRIKDILGSNGIAFREDPFLVRGLDYYTGIVFEMHLKGLGAQSAVMGGGRYDALVGELGGPDLPAVGFACGMERLILAMENLGSASAGNGVDVFVVSSPEFTNAADAAYALAREVRLAGFSAAFDSQGKSVKAQMRAASRSGAKYVLFPCGTTDAFEVKDMAASDQKTMNMDAFLAMLKEKS